MSEVFGVPGVLRTRLFHVVDCRTRPHGTSLAPHGTLSENSCSGAAAKYLHGIEISPAPTQVVYVSGRKRDPNEMNGKSGNINNCCSQIYPKGTKILPNELVCIFDADQVFEISHAFAPAAFMCNIANEGICDAHALEMVL